MYYLSNFSSDSYGSIIKDSTLSGVGTAGNILTTGFLAEPFTKGKTRKALRRTYPKLALAGGLGIGAYKLGKRLLKRKKKPTKIVTFPVETE